MKHPYLLKPSLCLAFVFFMVLSSFDSALACKCTAPPNLSTMREYARWRSDNAQVILEGTVEKLEVKEGALYDSWVDGESGNEDGFYSVVTVRVSTVYGGPKQQSATFITGMGWEDCGVGFRTGDEYLIYASKGPGENIFTDICMGTNLLEQEGPARRFLRGDPPAPEDLRGWGKNFAPMNPPWGGKICGKVTLPREEVVHEGNVQAWDTKRVLLIPIIGRFGYAADEGEIEADGSYCSGPLDLGEYWVGAEAGPRCEQSPVHFEGYFSSASSVL